MSNYFNGFIEISATHLGLGVSHSEIRAKQGVASKEGLWYIPPFNRRVFV